MYDLLVRERAFLLSFWACMSQFQGRTECFYLFLTYLFLSTEFVEFVFLLLGPKESHWSQTPGVRTGATIEIISDYHIYMSYMYV